MKRKNGQTIKILDFCVIFTVLHLNNTKSVCIWIWTWIKLTNIKKAYVLKTNSGLTHWKHRWSTTDRVYSVRLIFRRLWVALGPDSKFAWETYSSSTGRTIARDISRRHTLCTNTCSHCMRYEPYSISNSFLCLESRISLEKNFFCAFSPCPLLKFLSSMLKSNILLVYKLFKSFGQKRSCRMLLLCKCN